MSPDTLISASANGTDPPNSTTRSPARSRWKCRPPRSAHPAAQKSCGFVRRLAPIDIKTAISRFFSITIMIKVIRMLSAATSWIKPIVIAVTTFSIFRALRIWRYCSIQVLATRGGPAAFSAALADFGRLINVIELQLKIAHDVAGIEHKLGRLERSKGHGGIYVVKTRFDKADHAELIAN